MKTTLHKLMLLGPLVLAAGVFAHAASVAGGAGGALGGAVNPPVLPPVTPTPPPPNVSGGAATNAGVGAATNGATASGQMNANAGVTGSTHDLSVAGLASSGASASLNAGETAHAIHAQAIETRGQLFAELNPRIEASAQAMGELRKSSRQMNADSRAKFDAADKDVKAKEKTLKESLKTAQKASAATWVESRDHLAADYEAYARAVADAEAAANIGAMTKS